MKKLLFSTLLVAGGLACRAQDFQFTQAFNAPMVFNPAATGGQALYRSAVTALYRGMWDNAYSDQSYQGAALAAETRFCLPRQQRNFFALGAVAQHDWSPLGSLSNTQALLTGAFHFHLGGDTYAAAGASVGALNYRVDPSRLRFDAQYRNGLFSAANGNGEAFETNSRVQPDVHAGAQLANNSRGWSAGVAWRHLNQPAYSFVDDENRLGIGLTLHGAATVDLPGNKQRLLLRGLYQRQSVSGVNSKQQQLITGVLYHLYAEGDAGRHVQAGAYLRSGSSSAAAYALHTLIPTVQVGNHRWVFSLSYDVNLQRVRSRFAGGLELGMGVRFGEVDRCVRCPAWGG